MIYAIKLLFAVLLTAAIAIRAFRSSFDGLLSRSDYRLAWMQIALASAAVYLSKFPLVFLALLAGVAVWAARASGRGVVGKLATFVLLTIILPPVTFGVGGLEGLNYVIQLGPERVLALVLLVPAALRLAGTRKTPGAGALRACDWLVVGYQVLRLALIVPSSTVTTLARTGFEEVLDVMLPYYVLSRGIRNAADLRHVGSFAMIGLLFAGAIGLTECLTQHNLYSGLQSIYDVKWQITYQLMRGNLIRVEAMMTQPIILAFSMMFALGLWVWLKGGEWRSRPVAAVFIVLFITLVGTFSRGPWLATGLLFVALFALSRLSPRGFSVLLVGAILLGTIIEMSGGEQIFASALAALFGGATGDMASIDYRRQLLDSSLALIKQRPWLGVSDYQVQLQALRQGEGIIDIVNTYIVLLLNTGVIGLVIYMLPFVIFVRRMLAVLPANRDEAIDPGVRRFAWAFVALTVASLAAIFTTSSYGVMQLLLLLLLAFPRAWLAMSAAERTESPVVPAEPVQTGRYLGRDASGRPFHAANW